MSDRCRPPPPPLALRGHATLTDLLGRSTGRRPPVTFASPPPSKPAAATPRGEGCCPLCGRRVAPAAALAAHAAACADADDVRRACKAGGRQQMLAGNEKQAAEVIQEAPPAAPSPPGPRSFDAACVARRLARAVDAPAGTDAVLARDRANPADGNAVAVVPRVGATLGYLPRAVAAALAPALDGGGVVGVATLLADARGAAAVPVRVTLTGAAAATAAAAARAAAATADTAPAAAARAALADVVDSALTHDAALWLEAEAAALARLRALPPAAAAFYLTLYRAADTGRWHRPAKWEGGDGVQAAAALVDAGLAAAATTPSDVAAAAAALTAPELRAVLNAPASRKAGLVAAAAAAVGDAATRSALAAALACVPASSTLPPPHAIAVRLRSTPATALRRAERAYWGDEGASVADAGGAAAAAAAADVPPPQYELSRPPPLFASRQDLEDYEAALVQAGALDDALNASETDDADAAVRAALAPLTAFVVSGAARDAPPPPHLPPFLAHVCAAAIRTAAASVGAAWLERRREWREASAVLRALLGARHWPRRRGEWWIRLAVNADHAGSPTTALEITTAALADAAVDGGDRLGLQRRFLRLGRPPRRWGAPPAWAAHAAREPRVVTIEAAPTGRAVGVKSRFVLGDKNGVEANGAARPPAPTSSVEGLALHHYASTGGWAGTHGEGGPWARLFGLLLGGVVWGAAPAGALPRPGLWAPLDVGTPAFYAARAAALDAVLAELAGCEPQELATRVLTAWRSRCGGAVTTTARTPPTDLADVAACAGPSTLTTIFRLIARAGGVAPAFPDLTLWRVTGRTPAGVALAGRLRLVEVKGPRDRLSDGQRVVLAALEDGGVDCEVLKVVEPTRKRKKE